jgi:polar amino acid transport system ATP-binding protein
MILEMNNIRKHFDGMEVLKDISFGVDSGEVVSIIGPSGSGKSTLLRCATFLETIDGGEIKYMDQVAAHTDEHGNAVYVGNHELHKFRSYCGLVFQQFNLFPHFSVLKNLIDAPVHVQRRSKEEATETAMELLAKMGLADRADAYPFQLSGGQQQRVAIVRALMMDPELLLLDEITSALDPLLVGEVLDMVEELKAQGATILMATHEMGFAHDAADRIVLLRRGAIAENGTPHDVMDSPSDPETYAFFHSRRRP